MADTAVQTSPLLLLPSDMLVLLPEYLHNIEDHMNLSSTCKALRACMAMTSPRTILKLAAAQAKIFFRPSPDFLFLTTARELGAWARQSRKNEAVFAEKCKQGVAGLLELALQHCGLPMPRIRDLYRLRFSVINPVTNIIDQCVGEQWGDPLTFWSGGVSDAATIHSDPTQTFFHLATYGELFAPDLESYLEQNEEASRLEIQTRLEFVKYCIPNWRLPISVEETVAAGDARVVIEDTGPYAVDVKDGRKQYADDLLDHLDALVWVLKSSRWKPHWKETRRLAMTNDFEEGFKDEPDDEWFINASDDKNWRQRLWENVMNCQGIEGLAMIRPNLRQEWFPKIRDWKTKIEKLEKEDRVVRIGLSATYRYPYLWGDLSVLFC